MIGIAEVLPAIRSRDCPDLSYGSPGNQSAGKPLPEPMGTRMLDGFTKRDLALFAGVLLLAGALTVGVVDFVIYHYVFQDTNAAPILAK